MITFVLKDEAQGREFDALTEWLAQDPPPLPSTRFLLGTYAGTAYTTDQHEAVMLMLRWGIWSASRQRPSISPNAK